MNAPRTTRTALVVGVLSLAVACTDLTVTSPVSVPGPHRVETGTTLGSGSIYIPSTNLTCTTSPNYNITQCDGGVPWTLHHLDVTLQAGQWAALRVRGAVHAEDNPALAPYRCSSDDEVTLRCLRGGFPLDGKDVGPFGVKENPALSLISFGVYVRLGRIFGFPNLPRIAVDGDSSVMQSFLWGRFDSYEVWRTGSPSGWCPGTENCDPGIAAYVLSGDQTIEVVAVDPPATVTAEPAGGDSIRFTGTSEYELTGISWHFRPNDTLPEPGWNEFQYADRYTWSDGIFNDSIRGCTGRVTCDFVPPAAGRMYMKAQLVNGSELVALPAVFVSQVVRPETQKRLELICSVDRAPNTTNLNAPENLRSSVTLTRGQFLSCVVHAVRVPTSNWRPDTLFFADTEGHVIGSREPWSVGGFMAVGGTLTVRGRIDGSVYADNVDVRVLPRNWHVSPPPIRVDTVGCAPPVTRECPLGYPPYYAKDLGQTRSGGWNWSAYTIPSGPNAGWSYVANKTPPFNPPVVVIFLNRLFSASDTSAYARDFFKFATGCTREEFREDVMKHERFHANGYISHLDTLNAHLEDKLAFGLTQPQWTAKFEPGGDIRSQVDSMVVQFGYDHNVDSSLLKNFPPQECGAKGIVPNPPGHTGDLF